MCSTLAAHPLDSSKRASTADSPSHSSAYPRFRPFGALGSLQPPWEPQHAGPCARLRPAPVVPAQGVCPREHLLGTRDICRGCPSEALHTAPADAAKHKHPNEWAKQQVKQLQQQTEASRREQWQLNLAFSAHDMQVLLKMPAFIEKQVPLTTSKEGKQYFAKAQVTKDSYRFNKSTDWTSDYTNGWDVHKIP